MKASVTFSQPPISDENLNKVLCFFTKEIDTEVFYLLDIESNSCYDRAVNNVYYNYTGDTFSAENHHTIIYMITNPYLISDPSPTAFQNMFGDDKQLTAATKSSAVSGFAINYMSVTYRDSFEAIDMIDRTEATKSLTVTFDKPTFSNNMIKVPNVGLAGGVGTVYFLLVLYKQINIDGNNTYVNIRMNEQPSEEQMLNCENWEGLEAQGCARAVYSSTKLTVSFSNIEKNSLYVLYYAAASEYPLRPVMSEEIFSETIVTFAGMAHLMGSLALLLMMVWL